MHVCLQVRERTIYEMRAERDADDTNGLLLHLRTQVTLPSHAPGESFSRTLIVSCLNWAGQLVTRQFDCCL